MARYRPFLIICLILLDVLIAKNIVLAKTSQNSTNVLGSRARKIVRVATSTPSPTLTLTPTPSSAPTPTATPTKTLASPTPVPPTQPSTQINAPASPGSGSLLEQLNAFRSSHGLPPVQSDPNTCNFASTRAREISMSFDHSGFQNRISSHTLPYSSYHEVTENIAMTGDPNGVIPMWINSPGHNANMQKDTPYVCIMNFGNYYAYEGWRP